MLLLLSFRRFTPVPDSVLLSAHAMSGTTNELDAKQQMGGFTTPFPGMASVVPGTQSSLKRGLTDVLILCFMSIAVNGKTICLRWIPV